MSVILIFLDGVGIGEDNPAFNPCLHSKYQIFSPRNDLPFSGIRFPLDARLNVDGLPQSASGQTAIYTGKNAAKHIGKHLFGFPNEKLRKLIDDFSIFKKLGSMNYKCKFINAFRPIFFTSPELFENLRMSATTEMNRRAGLSFNSLKDIKSKNALYHDYTNSEIINKGFNLPRYNSEIASEILLNQTPDFDFILYEYFLTDKAGHSRNMEFAVQEINKVELLIHNVVKKMNQTENTLMVCSDHGNIEDLRSKSHTLNPAFFGIWSSTPVPNLKSITDIFPLIVKLVSAK